jgi:TPR repeat protein
MRYVVNSCREMVYSTVKRNLSTALRHTLVWICLVAAFSAHRAQAQSETALGIERADTVVGVETLLARARVGDVRASFLLGTRYPSGRAGYRDDSEALRWFRQAAEDGLAEAQYNLGIMYASGRGVSPGLSRAVPWSAEAAAQGVVWAPCTPLGPASRRICCRA